MSSGLLVHPTSMEAVRSKIYNTFQAEPHELNLNFAVGDNLGDKFEISLGSFSTTRKATGLNISK